MEFNKYGLTLEQTCSACPEQYNVFLGEDIVGYMRLRPGYFYAEAFEQTVYEASPNGDGIFGPVERPFHLSLACKAIRETIDMVKPI